MPECLQADARRMFIDANLLRVFDPDVLYHPEDDGGFDVSTTGLVGVTLSGPVVACGTHVGDVQVGAELWDGAPPVEAGAWQDVAEVSVPWAGPVMLVCGDGPDEDEAIEVGLPGPGTYRLRVHARHRDEGEDRDEGDPVETLLIRIWPAEGPRTSAIVHKATSITGAVWRGEHRAGR
ncbi:hypothetical protein [Streptomyces gilvosporeus]|uniref:Uncharacterized protein n=1 Tax=Streptomyces gilvosporeus TaxID=553510 RepID=A0A1V0TZQ8_9ACTN|nr:hypothetical protein [Streptomyces gilvosporeus]ARF58426.1 hypothetical protein B1H19_33350 [Streptomyces gilvosporeus]